jgi:hypothetical protein
LGLPISLEQLEKGIRIPVLKMAKWAHFGILGLIFDQIESDRFTGFSKYARIGKPGLNCGFRG